MLGAKRLELLRQLVPKATTIAMLVRPDTTETEAERIDVQNAARASSLAVMVCGRETASAAAGYGANSREECRAAAWIRPYSDPVPLCLAGRR